jgi:hypothetical protein
MIPKILTITCHRGTELQGGLRASVSIIRQFSRPFPTKVPTKSMIKTWCCDILRTTEVPS